MDEIVAQLDQISEHWNSAFEAAEGSPALWQPYLKGVSLPVLNEAFQTLKRSMKRVRAPTGFHPVFMVAKQFAATSLPGLLQISQQLAAGQYQQLMNFTNTIVSLLGATHTMNAFAQKESNEASLSDLSSQVSEVLAVLGTAQRELAGKAQQLESANTLALEIVDTHSNVKALEADAAAAVQAANASKDANATSAEQAQEAVDEIQTQKKQFEKLVSEVNETKTEAKVVLDSLLELKQRCEKQEELIDSLLPKAASAGLAAAFAKRGSSLDPTKWTWMTAFLVTVLALAAFATYLTTLQPPAGTGYWQFVLYRAALAGPLIWLGWFSAIQYGNTIRIQEDYAFKEATSKAFQGYRDHLQYLAQIDTEAGGNAMTLLAAKTIEILAREPLRIYGRVHHDVSPLQTVAHVAQSLKGIGDKGSEPRRPE